MCVYARVCVPIHVGSCACVCMCACGFVWLCGGQTCTMSIFLSNSPLTFLRWVSDWICRCQVCWTGWPRSFRDAVVVMPLCAVVTDSCHRSRFLTCVQGEPNYSFHAYVATALPTDPHPHLLLSDLTWKFSMFLEWPPLLKSWGKRLYFLKSIYK